MNEKAGRLLIGLLWGVLFSLPIWASIVGLTLLFISNRGNGG